MRHKPATQRIDWRVLLIACATVALGHGLGSAGGGSCRNPRPGPAGFPGRHHRLDCRQEATTRTRSSAGEGVATVVGPRHSTVRAVPRNPVGTEQSARLRVGATSGTPTRSADTSSTLIKVPAPETRRCFSSRPRPATASEYLHTLVPGELYNNSFVAVSPDTQWMVAGEWETMSHLQIYPTPLLNHKSPLTVARCSWPATSSSITR